MRYATMNIHENSKTIIVNHKLLTGDQIKEIENVVKESFEKYDITNNDTFILDKIEISKRLKTSAGVCNVDGYTKKIKMFSIKLAHNCMMEFGFKSTIKTLKHELAHLIECVLYGKMSHSKRFKLICYKLGGSMNTKMAGALYSKCASDEYCKKIRKSSVYSYEYTCIGCGDKFIRRKVFTTRMMMLSACGKCNTKCSEFELKRL